MPDSMLKEILEKEEKNSIPLREIDESDEMIDVGMNAYGVTESSSVNPVLKTVGAGSCVALAIYDLESGTAGLAHIIPTSKKEEVEKDVANLLSSMKRNGAKVSQASTRAYMYGGIEGKIFSQWVRDIIRENNIPITSQEETKQDQIYGHSIAIDARTGEVFRLKNIKSQKIKEADFLNAITKKEEGINLTSDSRSLP